MTSRNSPARFSRNLVISAGLVVLLAVSFILYVRAERQVDSANVLRHESYLLADLLRQSGDDLTRMIRTYVETGDPVYKQRFLDILDIRDGKKPRPENYSRPYWDLILGDGPAPRGSGPAIALLELMRQAGFTEEEFGKLAEAKANSDRLTLPEFEAMKLIESTGPDAEANRAKARMMMYDAKYHQAKFAILSPIHDFFVLVDQRTLAAVQVAEVHAATLRYAFIVFGLGLIFMLWRTHAAMRHILGGSLEEIHAQIAKIGRGDFTSSIKLEENLESSILRGISATQARLKDSSLERDRAELALKESERRLSFALQTIHTGGWELNLVDHTAYRTLEHDRIFGYESLLPQWTYETFLEHVLPEDRAEVDRLFREAIAAQTDWNFECRIRRADGEVRWIRAAGGHQRDGQAPAQRMAGIVQDISESKKAELKIRDQLAELVRWQVVMLDREDRVEELKAEVNQLFIERGQPVRYASPGTARPFGAEVKSTTPKAPR